MGICKRCGKRRKFLSKRGICAECASKAHKLVTMQLIAKKGKAYENWRKGMMSYLNKTEEQEA